MFSEPLNAVKIGIGGESRLEELFSAKFEDPSSKAFIDSEWKTLKLAYFKPGLQNNFQAFKRQEKAWVQRLLAAEQNVLSYWRSDLKLKPFLTTNQMGVSPDLKRKIHGESETAQMNQVCEIGSWALVESLPGYTQVLMTEEARDLICLIPNHNHLKYVNDGGGSADQWEYRIEAQEDEFIHKKRNDLHELRKLRVQNTEDSSSNVEIVNLFTCTEEGCERQSSSQRISTLCIYHQIKRKKEKKK